jgi:hypothetical protein
MILQAVSLLCKLMMLVILPLDQIRVEQAEYITQISRNPCFRKISPPLLKKVQQAQFTRILISPELAISDKFHTTAANLRFNEQLSLVAVIVFHDGAALNCLHTARPIAQSARSGSSVVFLFS